MVDLGHIFGLRVVAEGIEDEAQLDALRGLGCALGQGYLLCRPADAVHVPEILARRSLTSTPAAALAAG
jgi:EAL domain-containing protein (putative c-di-GMP-specific phosphodiesterase class I)